MKKTAEEKKPLSQQKAAALAAAHKASREKMAGRSPRTVGKERTNIVLDWVLRWGWSTPTTLELVTGSLRSGIGNRLVKNGLLIKTKTKTGGINDTPTFILTLSPIGYDLALENYGNIIPYELNPEKINQSLINHSEKVQRLTAFMLREERIYGFKTEKELTFESKKSDEKHPDAMWKEKVGNGKYIEIAIEVELTPKWEREFDRFIYQTLYSVASFDKKEPRFQKVKIFAKSNNLLQRYENGFMPGQTLKKWRKDDGGRWVRAGDDTVPSWSSQKVSFHLITHSMICSPDKISRNSNLEGLTPPDLDELDGLAPPDLD